MVLFVLDILKCHLVLAIKDKSMNDLLEEESTRIQKLLIQLVDLPLTDKMQKVITIHVLPFEPVVCNGEANTSSVNTIVLKFLGYYRRGQLALW